MFAVDGYLQEAVDAWKGEQLLQWDSVKASHSGDIGRNYFKRRSGIHVWLMDLADMGHQSTDSSRSMTVE